LNTSSDSTTSSPYRIASSVVLSRPPTLTADLTPFEESFYFYQRRLNQRLALPFTRYFYLKKGTPADAEWKRKQKAAGDKYTGFGPRSWADELLVGDESQKSEDNGYRRLVETTITGEASNVEEGVEGEEKKLDIPLPRISKADKEGDRKSLDRAMTRTLYLLVKSKDRSKHAWRFPQSPVMGRENLKEAAQRTLEEAAGVNMNTWFVGNVPIGHYIYNYGRDYTVDSEKIGKKVFFMKARIMAGQADLNGNKLGLEDFLWLTKEEVEEVAGRAYFKAVRHMLVS
ncbi:39S mitochondrial ribosomal protein L46-domain-containing protein, partial [Trichophaea hybrida]